MISYRVILDVPVQLARYLARLLRERRREIGIRAGTRALTRKPGSGTNNVKVTFGS